MMPLQPPEQAVLVESMMVAALLQLPRGILPGAIYNAPANGAHHALAIDGVGGLVVHGSHT